ncbi:hypothetical protein [Deinococcus sp.]|uniref:hypothetical protein n=1 Tax=Deinococcus sp. TaxID=47478 RepID=UPI003CC61583
MPTPLDSLLTYFEPLSTLRRDFRGTATLHTPGSPLLGANASYLPEGSSPDLFALLRVWHQAHDSPPLVVSASPLPGLPAVESLRVGPYLSAYQPGMIVAEQVSRLHLDRFAAVLCESCGLPEWAAPLSRTLASSLEHALAATLLLAYAGDQEIGALLLLGNAAHLWGTLDPAADAPLLNAAAALVDGDLWTSLPDTSPLSVSGGAEVHYSLLVGDGPDYTTA